jgi:selenobiotic family peptide radical SAM maturase
VAARTIHPGVNLIEVAWQGLPELLAGQGGEPRRGNSLILLQALSEDTPPRVFTPSRHDLLALKLVAEAIPNRVAAVEANVDLGTIDDILWAAEKKGLLQAPASTIVRPKHYRREQVVAGELLRAPAFTLQWHLTQACDLHCRHCYDRTPCPEMALAQGLAVLDQLYDFCQDHHVYGQVSFTGGNPLLAENFFPLYRAARERGLLTAILGNPITRAALAEICALGKPEFYQVSLEGLAEHDNYIRGAGHFEKVLTFLPLLREMQIFSMVMLTLTRANLDQVLPLAELLRHRTDLFTFNRLAMVGEGAALASVDPAKYRDFLIAFFKAAADNPIMSMKDSLFNILRQQANLPLGGGCAGFGCGAAFNFLALLPDGEVHACRKFPSPLGNVCSQSLAGIYHSPVAERYRQGSTACRECPILPGCGGCMAVSHGFGLDPFSALDPYCFRKPPPSPAMPGSG